MTKRNRIGCDGCKLDIPTEKFIGYCGNEIWLCNFCFDKLISKEKLFFHTFELKAEQQPKGEK